MTGHTGEPDGLLRADALTGVRIAVSVSESPDLVRLGLHEMHFRLALGEIARSVLISGGLLAYGGHLRPDGYTTFLVQELERYRRINEPLRICLAASEHGRISNADLLRTRNEVGLLAEIVCLDADGNPIAFDTERSAGADDAPRALSGLRRYMTANTQGRVVIGGKRSGFQGITSGVVEEALYALEAGQPLFLAGGFGGATIDVIRVVHAEASEWFVELAVQAQDDRLNSGLDAIRKIVAGRGWAALNNGLGDEENAMLAATPRPSEVAALVSLGMGRLFAGR